MFGEVIYRHVTRAIRLALILSFAVLADVMPISAAEPSRGENTGADTQAQTNVSPEQRMQSWFPQPAKVAHLIGLPVLDGNDSTIGYVETIIKTVEGKIRLIVPYKDRWGWARNGTWLAGGRRSVAVPIEAVQLLALQINAVDMDREAFKNAPTWSLAQSVILPQDEVIQIGIGRR